MMVRPRASLRQHASCDLLTAEPLKANRISGRVYGLYDGPDLFRNRHCRRGLASTQQTANLSYLDARTKVLHRSRQRTSSHRIAIFARRKIFASHGAQRHQYDDSSFLVGPDKLSMTTHETLWTDFQTDQHGLVYMCNGHADGSREHIKGEPGSVTCPFHSVTLFSPTSERAPNHHQDSSLEDQQSHRNSTEMATSTFFLGGDAAALVPLRQQIIGEHASLSPKRPGLTLPTATATVLFPAVVEGKHNTVFRWGHASPDVLFEIAILATTIGSEAHALAEGAASKTKFQAILTHGLVTKQSIAATGDMSETVVGALDSLLGVLCYELGKRREEAVEAIAESSRARSLGGYVNGGLFQKAGLGKGKGKEKKRT